MDYLEWLQCQRKRKGDLYSKATIYKYYNSVATISEDMLKNKVINKEIKYMTLLELDFAISIIFKNDFFIEKNTTGNNMYSNAIKQYRQYLYSQTDISKMEEEIVEDIKKDNKLTNTEKEVIIKARIGQGKFRELILKRFDRKCIITTISIEKTLIASHIKPWYLCKNTDRINEENGLLLSATYDRLFDSGLISFSDEGKLLISNKIDSRNAKILNLKKNQKYDLKLNANVINNLRYHREHIFVEK